MFGTELSVLHQHTARDRLVLGAACGKSLRLVKPGADSSPPPQDIPPVAAPVASGRPCRGRDRRCPGIANSPGAKCHGELL